MAGAVRTAGDAAFPSVPAASRPHDKLDPQTIDEKEPQWQP